MPSKTRFAGAIKNSGTWADAYLVLNFPLVAFTEQSKNQEGQFDSEIDAEIGDLERQIDALKQVLNVCRLNILIGALR